MLYTAERAAAIAQQRPEGYPTPEQIAQQHAELLQLLRDLSSRQANGCNVGGRYNKHDTARLRYIKDIALRGLRFGKLVPDADLKMLRLVPMNELVGADKAEMDAWAQIHGRDPRQRADGELTEAQQTTLLAWAAQHAADFAAPVAARRGVAKETSSTSAPTRASGSDNSSRLRGRGLANRCCRTRAHRCRSTAAAACRGCRF